MMFSSTLTVVQSSGPSDDSLVLRPTALSFAAWPRACCTLKHPLSDLRRPLGLCHPVSHGPDSSWDCRRVLHWIPPNEPDQHGPSGHGLHSSRCTQPCKCFNVAISQAVNVVVHGILCSPASNSAASLFVRSESLGSPVCLFRQTTRHLLALNMKLSLSFIRLCIESSKICGFELLSIVVTRHVRFLLQAFRLDDTCRCITTSTSITQSMELRLWNLHCFLNCLVVGTWHHSTTGTSALGMIWTTSTTTVHNPLLDLTGLVVQNLFNSVPLIARL